MKLDNDPTWIEKYDEETEVQYQRMREEECLLPSIDLDRLDSPANAFLLMREIDKEILTDLIKSAKEQKCLD